MLDNLTVTDVLKSQHTEIQERRGEKKLKGQRLE